MMSCLDLKLTAVQKFNYPSVPVTADLMENEPWPLGSCWHRPVRNKLPCFSVIVWLRKENIL